MDLSKAFNVIPHGLLLAKHSTFGLDANWVNLIYDDLKERLQRVKSFQLELTGLELVRAFPRGLC